MGGKILNLCKQIFKNFEILSMVLFQFFKLLEDTWKIKTMVTFSSSFGWVSCGFVFALCKFIQ